MNFEDGLAAAFNRMTVLDFENLGIVTVVMTLEGMFFVGDGSITKLVLGRGQVPMSLQDGELVQIGSTKGSTKLGEGA